MRRIVAAFALALAVSSPAAAQDKRVALVIGNAEYQKVFALKNPVNDATDVGAALARLGFTTTTLTNARAEEMRRALQAFGEKARAADVAVVFYAGHAIQADSVNWLIPVDGAADSMADVMRDAIPLSEILAQLDGVIRLGAIFLDAARNNPFADSSRPRRGLSGEEKEPKNVLIGYATGAGKKVSDGEGRNSPYTAALLRHIETPGLSVLQLLKRVQADVIQATNAQQLPAYYITLDDDAFTLGQR